MNQKKCAKTTDLYEKIGLSTHATVLFFNSLTIKKQPYYFFHCN